MKDTLWGTTGIRGSAKEFLTNQFVFDIGRAFAVFLSQKNASGIVTVGQDPRESSPRIAKALISGLFFEKQNVQYSGVVPIPAINRSLLDQDSAIAGCMVTGSHIEKSLNGLKFFAFEEEILKNSENEIEKIYHSLKGKKRFMSITLPKVCKTVHNDYLQYLIECAVDLPAWRVVVDPGNGAQTNIIIKVLKKLGLRVVKLNASLKRPMLSRDTEKSEDFASLSKKVVNTKSDFGVGFDSDGDRVIFCTNDGQIIYGDYLGALYAKHRNLEALVSPVNTSTILEKVVPKVIRCKVGSAYVVNSMRKNKISFGFESNGGMIFAPMLTRDGGRACIEIMNIMAQSKSTLSELVSKLPNTVMLKDKIKYDWAKEERILAEVKKAFKSKKVDVTDGLKIYLDSDSWILFRSSRNSPEFRVFVESSTKKDARQLLTKGIKLVTKYAK